MRPALLTSLLLVLSILYAKIKKRMENTLHGLTDLFVYEGKPGHVEFNCDEEEADGVLRCRAHDEYGRPTITATTFRITNRWPLTGRRRPGGLILMGIYSQAHLAGHNPLNLQWFVPSAMRLTVTSMDLRVLEQNPAIDRQTARRARLHNFLARWFPSPVVKNYDPRDHWDMIIKRL